MSNNNDGILSHLNPLQAPSINVGIGEYGVAASPSKLRTVLGSCVGVMIYESKQQIGGLAHIYLPYSYEFTEVSPLSRLDKKLSYADLLIPGMIAGMIALKGLRRHFLVYLTGGANLIKFARYKDFDIGKRNIAAAHEVLQKEGLTARELITGGGFGQTVVFNLLDGGIDIKVHETLSLPDP